ncbi:MAG: glutathione S-transferase [Hyphomonas sp.]|uniref:glutathione S-transferase family protein n=1 Tax=Hyphomonas sp. TaxID=87 RepID=UPI001830085A|nr:glutathione S-transferase family protein [Hyphomonas sp.]MBU3921091.1 glutathione S-transferase [Alphaproteobacteria bacterium]MBA3070492.1 glutathione S-transferase [Hyphomonas sp.]MBU4062022.1 glutathione S-transferase [Alphaproteobacteria bacterium]MBU4164958.1 glutathione S-transferase [Alphaproteobacteria bacterium]MBU4568277.1 glutathione S-transferase [Alphaproteobacteria bacterium]
MAAYRLFGAETSPYSLKVRSALRYKGLAFDWVSRSASNEAEFRKSAATPTVPLLLSPDHAPAQDSTLILAALNTAHPEPEAAPEEPTCAALALILEDYGDEWLNKCMFQQRWGQQPDRDAAALRVLVQLSDGKRPRAFKAPAKQIASRMLARLPLVGAEPENAATLEASYRRFAQLLNAHLQNHLFIFGGRPSAADFAIAAQFQQMLTDPTPATWLTDRAPFVVAWCGHMEDPKASGPFAPLDELSATLLPIFEGEVSRTYLPWAFANAASASREKKRFSVTFDDGVFEQATQSYAARAFAAVRAEVAGRMSDPALPAFLDAAGARAYVS